MLTYDSAKMFALKLSAFCLASLASAAILDHASLNGRAVPCYPGVYVVVARGTFEYLELGSTYGFQGSVVDAILKKIPGSNATVIKYPENTDIKTGVPIGVAAVQKALTDYYAACPTSKTVLMGYSQGAIVIGSALAGGPAYVPIFGSTGTGPAPLDRTIGDNGMHQTMSFRLQPCLLSAVAAIVQFGDLNRVEGVGIDGEVSDKPCKTDSVSLEFL